MSRKEKRRRRPLPALALMLLAAGVLLGNGMLLALGLLASGIALYLLSDKSGKREV